jgi:hypothetical protein
MHCRRSSKNTCQVFKSKPLGNIREGKPFMSSTDSAARATTLIPPAPDPATLTEGRVLMGWVNNPMRFPRRHRYLLIFSFVLILCSFMVIREYLAREWAHVDLREDFILLHQKGLLPQTERLYQLLIQDLPSLPDRSLLDDYSRTQSLVDATETPKDDLVWKYSISVKNELDRRLDERVARALKRAGK